MDSKIQFRDLGREGGTESLQTPRWSKGDSNSPSHPERQRPEGAPHGSGAPLPASESRPLEKRHRAAGLGHGTGRRDAVCANIRLRRTIATVVLIAISEVKILACAAEVGSGNGSAPGRGLVNQRLDCRDAGGHVGQHALHALELADRSVRPGTFADEGRLCGDNQESFCFDELFGSVG
jgi:hypothetical protein